MEVAVEKVLSLSLSPLSHFVSFCRLSSVRPLTSQRHKILSPAAKAAAAAALYHTLTIHSTRDHQFSTTLPVEGRRAGQRLSACLSFIFSMPPCYPFSLSFLPLCSENKSSSKKCTGKETRKQARKMKNVLPVQLLLLILLMIMMICKTIARADEREQDK